VAFAERAWPRLEHAEAPVWLDRLQVEHDNLRAAVRWMIERGEARMALDMGWLLWTFWRVRGHRVEGMEYLSEVLALPGASAHPIERAKALYGLGILAYGGGDFVASRCSHEASLATSR